MTNQLKQPATLYITTTAYMCERFGYFMLRTILVLYMINLLMMPTEDAYATFASFSALMFLAPLVGGKFIDRNFDHHHAAMFGGILLAAGLFCIAFANTHFLNFSLALIICGKGFYAPGIISSIGNIYHQGDARREHGFMTMYSAINLSAIIASLSAPIMIAYYGWQLAFCAAGAITLIGNIILYYHNSQKSDYKSITPTQKFEVVMLTGACLMVCTMLLWSQVMSYIFMITLSATLFLYTLLTLATLDQMERKQTLMCFMLTAFTLIFFTLSQQSAMSLTVFAENHVNRALGHIIVPTFYFIALNPFFIILLTPLMSLVWRQLKKHHYVLSTPKKFAIGTILTGIGFLVLTLAITCMHTPEAKINLSWLVLSYFFQTLGELFIVPIGFAMITDLAPRQMTGYLIGVWFFMIAIANELAGLASRYTISISHINMHHVTGALAAYANVYGMLGSIAILSGLGLFLVSGIFKKSVVRR